MYLDPTLIDCEFPILYRNFLCMFIFSFASFTFHVYLSPPKSGLSDRFSPRVCTVLPPPPTFYDTIRHSRYLLSPGACTYYRRLKVHYLSELIVRR